nr:MAG TPA: Putative methyltransferase [Caudoviricetes sp.]DAO97088.1 MAG TPA: Putative methyltransferase [Caudoviricetes sp.]
MAKDQENKNMATTSPLEQGEVKRLKPNLEECFEVLLPGGRVYYTGEKEVQAGLQIVDLSRVPYNALVLYITGFKYLALKEGAVALFSELGAATLEKLIAQKREHYPKDVQYLERALQMKRGVAND